LRVALSDHREERFLDRIAYDRRPITDDLRASKDVWIFAPVGTNFLTEERCTLLRRGPLARDGWVGAHRGTAAVRPGDPISEQLDALLDHPVQSAASSLRETHARLEAMTEWQVNGTSGYGEIAFNPGFSIVAINPQSADGYANVEFHGFRNDAIGSPMHIQLTRADGQWFKYWLEQFEEIRRSTLPAGR
jgi:hypothetical protein